MGAPLTVNTNADVEINDSCNCCFPLKRRHKHVDKKVEKVYKDADVKKESNNPVSCINKNSKKIKSEPNLQSSGEWIFENIPK